MDEGSQHTKRSPVTTSALHRAALYIATLLACVYALFVAFSPGDSSNPEAHLFMVAMRSAFFPGLLVSILVAARLTPRRRTGLIGTQFLVLAALELTFRYSLRRSFVAGDALLLGAAIAWLVAWRTAVTPGHDPGREPHQSPVMSPLHRVASQLATFLLLLQVLFAMVAVDAERSILLHAFRTSIFLGLLAGTVSADKRLLSRRNRLVGTMILAFGSFSLALRSALRRDVMVTGDALLFGAAMALLVAWRTDARLSQREA